MNGKREMLRHTLATIAYRGGKTLNGAPDAFATFRAGDSTRTPGEILAHIGDLFDWALTTAKGAQQWKESAQLPWDQEIARFFAALGQLDAFLASDAPLACAEEQLLQGPIADALTHVGQLALVRPRAGAAKRGVNYFKADIAAGRVGRQQSPPRREF
jgi:hypothetical protein